MKSKILKIILTTLMLITLTSTNFLFVGVNLISYAADNVATNHENVEFEAYFKDENGKETMAQEKTLNQEEMFIFACQCKERRILQWRSNFGRQ